MRARLCGQEAVMFVPRYMPTHAGRRVARPLATLHGDPVDALRALAPAAWDSPQWTAVRAGSPGAAAAVAALGLGTRTP